MASFKTAYLQREIIQDFAVANNMRVGNLVILTPASGDVPAYISRTASLSSATHIVAQSDTTLEYGHVPVEHRDYRYSDIVAATFSGSADASSPVKKVALFAIPDKNDVKLDLSNAPALEALSSITGGLILKHPADEVVVDALSTTTKIFMKLSQPVHIVSGAKVSSVSGDTLSDWGTIVAGDTDDVIVITPGSSNGIAGSSAATTNLRIVAGSLLGPADATNEAIDFVFKVEV